MRNVEHEGIRGGDKSRKGGGIEKFGMMRRESRVLRLGESAEWETECGYSVWWGGVSSQSERGKFQITRRPSRSDIARKHLTFCSIAAQGLVA